MRHMSDVHMNRQAKGAVCTHAFLATRTTTTVTI